MTLLQPGDRCGDHQILRHLGTGGRAEVYAALGPTREPRALKLFAATGDRAAKAQARLAQEAEALSMIVHPNVVRFYDAGVWQGRVCISLELIEGETLRHKLEAGERRPPLVEVLRWIYQACCGLAAAHALNVVHRALAPDQILVTPSGVVKVIGFGLAKFNELGVKTTSLEQQVGTAKYMAPEVAQCAPADPTMDIYSMGHVLYEAIAGVHAMGSHPRSMPSVVTWQLSERPAPLRSLAPDVSSGLEALVHQALEKNPAARPESMEVLCERLLAEIAELSAPLRRAARNLLPSRVPSLAPTVPLPVVEDPPAAPTVPRTLPAVTLRSATAEPRTSDAPVEGPARRSSAPPRSPAAALAVAAAALVTLVAADRIRAGERVGHAKHHDACAGSRGSAGVRVCRAAGAGGERLGLGAAAAAAPAVQAAGRAGPRAAREVMPTSAHPLAQGSGATTRRTGTGAG